MSGFDFAWPLALLALAVVPAIAVLAWRGARHRAEADARYGGSADLRVGRSNVLRVARVTLLLVAIAVLIVGVARPRWGAEEAEVHQRGIDVVFAVDVSRSMDADDISPSRAEAVSDSLRDMLTHLHGNRVGMVIFGDSAFERAPLTLDVDAIGTLVRRAQAEGALVESGTSLAVGIDAALDALDVGDPAHVQAIVIASDGEDLSGVPIEPALERARERGVAVHALFAGTDVPTSLGSAHAEDVTTADRSTMELIANGTGGELREPSNAAGLAVEFRRMRQTAFETGTDFVPTERFPWFIGAGLVLLLAQTLVPEAIRYQRRRPRRGAVALGAAGLLIVAGCSGTALWQHVDSGNEAYRDGQYEEALDEYRAAEALDEEGEHRAPIGYNTGNALHQLDRFNSAIEATRDAIDATDDGIDVATMRYALGNHHFRHEDLVEARDAYIAVLRFNPNDADAKANLELVLGALAEVLPPEEELPPEEAPDGFPGDEPGDGNGDAPADDEAMPGDEADDVDPNGENGEPGDALDDLLDPSPGDPGNGEPLDELDDVRSQLEAMLGEFGEEITPQEARLLLELHRRLNELDRLPMDQAPGDTVPPR